MGRIIRTISKDASVVCSAIEGKDIVSRIEEIHKTSAVVTAGLGRLAMATSLLGFGLKGEKDSVTVRMAGDGPTGALICVADSFGNVKAYVQNPVVEIPLNERGKLDVKGAVGTQGTLSVVKDLGLKEPYCGQVPIVSGEIAEDITSYLALSEQIPSVCALGVLVNPDLTVKCAGGFLIQLLPFAPEEAIDTIEKNINNMKSVTEMLSEGMSIEQIVLNTPSGMHNNAGQILNHNMYFSQFTAKPQQAVPTGKLAEAISRDFGSFDAFKEEFQKKGATLFGSGWVWLSADKDGKLVITQETNAANPIQKGLKPLLTFDVWEHAYYLDYQNRRPDHLAALWQIVNWQVVESRYA